MCLTFQLRLCHATVFPCRNVRSKLAFAHHLPSGPWLLLLSMHGAFMEGDDRPALEVDDEVSLSESPGLEIEMASQSEGDASSMSGIALDTCSNHSAGIQGEYICLADSTSGESDMQLQATSSSAEEFADLLGDGHGSGGLPRHGKEPGGVPRQSVIQGMKIWALTCQGPALHKGSCGQLPHYGCYGVF